MHFNFSCLDGSPWKQASSRGSVDKRTVSIGDNSSSNTTSMSAAAQHNSTTNTTATTITTSDVIKPKVYWDHTSKLINYLVKSYSNAKNVSGNVTQKDDVSKAGKAGTGNITVAKNTLKPPSNPSPDSTAEDTKSPNATGQGIQEVKDDKLSNATNLQPAVKEVKEAAPSNTGTSKPLGDQNTSPINPDDIDVNDIVTTSNTGSENCADDENCGETGEGEDRVHYDKKTTSMDSESQFENAFQDRIDKFVQDKTFSAKPLFTTGDGESKMCKNPQDEDYYETDESDSSNTRHTPCIPPPGLRPHRLHHHHRYLQTPNTHWSDVDHRQPLQMHLYNNNGPPSTQYGSHYGPHHGFVPNTAPLYTSHNAGPLYSAHNTAPLYAPHNTAPLYASHNRAPLYTPRLQSSANTVMGNLGGESPAYSSLGNVQTPITFGGYTVTGSQPDPQHNQVHLYTGPKQVHLFKAYNTSDINMNTKQQLQQIFRQDHQGDTCQGDECNGGYNSHTVEMNENEGGGFQESSHQPMVRMQQNSTNNQGEDSNGNDGYDNEGNDR